MIKGTMMILAKRAVLLVALLLGFGAALPAMAQELSPEHLALARKYVDLTDKASIYEVTIVQAGIDTMQTLVRDNPTLIDPVNTAVTAVLEDYKARKGELMDQFARVYALRFSMEELQQIVDFYSSPVGQKLAVSNTDVNTDLQTIMRLFEINLQTEFFARVRAQLKTAGYNL